MDAFDELVVEVLRAKVFWAHKSYKIGLSTENQRALAMPTCTEGERAWKPSTLKNRPQFTGNAGLNYIGWQLSRRGWHVTPTIRNARGSDMFVTDENETVKFGVQSKALSKRHSVPLGLNLEILRSDWWIITVHANSDNPVCYVMRLEEVQTMATQDSKHGNYWLIAKSYDRAEFREAWHRIDHMRQRNELSLLDTVEAQHHADGSAAELAPLSGTERV